MTFMNQSEACITRNIGQIVILAAIDKSVSPNSLEASICAQIYLHNTLKSTQ